MNTALSVTVVVIAAGKSSRMGSSLLAEFEGMPLVRRSTFVASGCECRSVVVVTGHRHREIKNAIADHNVKLFYKEDYLSRMAGSLGLGVKNAERDRPVVMLIMLADVQAVTVPNLNSLIVAFRSCQGICIVRAGAQGVLGNPISFPRILHGHLKALAGDAAARHIVGGAALIYVGQHHLSCGL